MTVPGEATPNRRRWREAVRAEAGRIGFRWQPTVVAAWAACALLIPTYHQGQWFLDGLAWLGGQPFADYCRSCKINYRILLDVAVPLVLLAVMREKPSEYGLGLGDKWTGLKLCAVCYLLYIPCFLLLYTNEGFQQYYAGVAARYHTWGQFLAHQTPLMIVLSVRTEFLFRGFLLFGIGRYYGLYAGILAQLVPYVLVHGIKAPLEAFGSLPVGLALAYVAVKTRSIWYGALLHGSIAWLFNALIFMMHSG